MVNLPWGKGGCRENRHGCQHPDREKLVDAHSRQERVGGGGGRGLDRDYREDFLEREGEGVVQQKVVLVLNLEPGHFGCNAVVEKWKYLL
jgi:hypothetical protein